MASIREAFRKKLQDVSEANGYRIFLAECNRHSLNKHVWITWIIEKHGQKPCFKTLATIPWFTMEFWHFFWQFQPHRPHHNLWDTHRFEQGLMKQMRDTPPKDSSFFVANMMNRWISAGRGSGFNCQRRHEGNDSRPGHPAKDFCVLTINWVQWMSNTYTIVYDTIYIIYFDLLYNVIYMLYLLVFMNWISYIVYF